ncbi:ATP synthase subunit delta [Buchnera aphidicola (Periphyllus testudinaceus)]|uniref:ATP synthase F1 subunit delta n=1 Tax=Buchnera aphidicola TaxID=9 RepID=UPI00346479B3
MIFYKNIIYSYSKAIFDIALKENKINRWEKFLKVLSYISIQKNIKIIFSECLNANKLYKIFKYFLFDFTLNYHEKNFLKIICKNNRTFLLFKIFEEFQFIKKKHENIIDVYLKSPYSLTLIQKNKIINILEKNTLKKINFKIFIKKKLIGGFILSINGFVIDYTIKNYLKSLKNFINI